MSKEDEEFPATYSVRLPTMMRKQLDENARQHGRSLHAEILLRLSASLGDSKSGFSETINDLDKNSEYVTRAEVEAMIQQALKNAGVLEK